MTQSEQQAKLAPCLLTPCLLLWERAPAAGTHLAGPQARSAPSCFCMRNETLTSFPCLRALGRRKGLGMASYNREAFICSNGPPPRRMHTLLVQERSARATGTTLRVRARSFTQARACLDLMRESPCWAFVCVAGTCAEGRRELSRLASDWPGLVWPALNGPMLYRTSMTGPF